MKIARPATRLAAAGAVTVQTDEVVETSRVADKASLEHMSLTSEDI